jgi:ABC-type uncharacterized transport system involved in gliding motility auxiliary subunit
VRADLTEDGLYTLSDSTRTILKNLDDTVTIRVYFTKDLPPSMQPLARSVDDILAEFTSAAGRKLQIEFADPGASVMDEQKAMLLGIPPIQLNVIERDKQAVAKIYLGMSVMYGDNQQVIPIVRDVTNLEYDISEAIVKVTSKELPKIAWWEFEGSNSFALMRGALERRYTVVGISPSNMSELSASNHAMLVLISPRTMSDEEMSALNAYVMGDGKIFALVDRYDVGRDMSVKKVESPIFDMLGNYGATVDDSLVLDRSNATAAFSGGPVTYHIPYAYWVDIRNEQFNDLVPAVADLQSVVLPWTSPIGFQSGSNPSHGEEILARTTPYAVTRSGDQISTDPQAANDALLSGKFAELPLIVSLAGPFASFKTGNGKGQTKDDGVDESPASSRIVVVGNSRWLEDTFLQNFPSNAALFENIIDSFAMGDMLVGIRSRQDASRPIAILPDNAREALRYFNVLIGPAIASAIAVVVLMRRRKARRKVLALYTANMEA